MAEQRGRDSKQDECDSDSFDSSKEMLLDYQSLASGIIVEKAHPQTKQAKKPHNAVRPGFSALFKSVRPISFSLGTIVRESILPES